MPRQLSLYCSRYKDCVEELIEFRNVHRDIQRDRRYFEWRYLERPCAIEPTVVWAEHEGRRVGALTVFAHDYFVLDGEHAVGILGDISVRKKCRALASPVRCLASCRKLIRYGSSAGGWYSRMRRRRHRFGRRVGMKSSVSDER